MVLYWPSRVAAGAAVGGVREDRGVNRPGDAHESRGTGEPGRDGAHEKGGVEGEGGRFRRTHLVPMPKVTTLAELNEKLAGYDEADDARRIGHRTHSVGTDFAVEAQLLRPLPGERFETRYIAHFEGEVKLQHRP